MSNHAGIDVQQLHAQLERILHLVFLKNGRTMKKTVAQLSGKFDVVELIFRCAIHSEDGDVKVQVVAKENSHAGSAADIFVDLLQRARNRPSKRFQQGKEPRNPERRVGFPLSGLEEP